MNEPGARPAFYERLLRRLLSPMFHAQDEHQARLGRLHDQLAADRGQVEQVARQLREAIDALDAQAKTARAAITGALEHLRGETRARGEAVAAALHAAHLRQDELDRHLQSLEADSERRASLAAGAFNELAQKQNAALDALGESLAARLQAAAGEARAASELLDARLSEKLRLQHDDWTARAAAIEQGLQAGRQEAEALAGQQAQNLSNEFTRLNHLHHDEAQRQTGVLTQIRSEITAHTGTLAVLQATQTEHAQLSERIVLSAAALDSRLKQLESPAEGLDYSAFEARFRGSEALIRERQQIYLPLLKDHPPIADLGCGRGELVALLREAGLDARGVERDEGQLALCRAAGLPVEGGDLFSWLAARPENSLGAITCLQVIEHLTLREQREFLSLVRKALRPGGLLLVETVNPHCPEALEWFYIDPTHERPVYPEMLEFLMEQAGFKGMTVRFQIPCTGAPAGQPLTAATGADFALWGFNP